MVETANGTDDIIDSELKVRGGSEPWRQLILKYVTATLTIDRDGAFYSNRLAAQILGESLDP